MDPDKIPIQRNQTGDDWLPLRSFTPARIALGRTGVSIPLKENLAFRLAHAHARDAVFSVLEMDRIAEELKNFQLPVLRLQTECTGRTEYLQRPDLGRLLNEVSRQRVSDYQNRSFDIAILLADGLSATAINKHAIPLLCLLIPLLRQASISIAPISIIENGRVAVGDEVGSLLRADISLILIGERPGLSSPDSMSAYLTWQPAIGLTDERRNCISNIRPEGLTYALAAEKLLYLLKEMCRLQISGVQLKDNALLPGGGSPHSSTISP
jgi:ethanolamine ammonia-lyase small subunit